LSWEIRRTLISTDAAARTVKAIIDEGGDATPVTADATDPNSVQSAVANALDTYGTIDGLHNNVGVAWRLDSWTLPSSATK
jgi:NAD(P)-dependent dehydrogenase (short-subunit alcohol dehydrogenase family)